MKNLKVIYAANRRIGLSCLRALIDSGIMPCALLIPSGRRAEFTAEMRALVHPQPVIEGTAFREPANIEFLRSLEPDYLISVHFPYIVPIEVLAIAKIGNLNLHPAYLPYNRGWHTPSWAILEGTPYGATLHWMDDKIDTGDIALRAKIEVLPHDTAHTLYQRVLELEERLFLEAIPLIKEGRVPRYPQESGMGTTHTKGDLIHMQRLDLEAQAPIGSIIQRLRALTTNRWDEAAWFEFGGKRYRVRVEIKPEEDVVEQPASS